MSAGPFSPIRVCFPFIGTEIGGSHVSALKLIQNLDRRRVAPVVVLAERQGALPDLFRREKQAFVELPLPHVLTPGPGATAGTLSYLARTLPLLRRFLQEGRIDLVHTNDGRTHVNWGLAARLAGAKLVWHHRGDPSANGVNRLAPLIANQVVTVSRFARPSRPVLSLAQRLSVVHSPFDPPSAVPDRPKAKADLLRELGLPSRTRVLSFIGALIERKRPLLFVEIVHRFRLRHPEIPIVGCVFGIPQPGAPDFEASARRLCAEFGLGDTVRFMGFRHPVEPCLAATDILLVPAVNEPFGRTLIEAMFLGTPVVATNHGGNPEAISDGRTGFLVEPENADAFVAPIAALLSDPLKFARISRAAGEQARISYGTAHHVARIMQVYASVLRPCAAIPFGVALNPTAPGPGSASPDTP